VGKSVATTMRIFGVITEKGNIASGATLIKIACCRLVFAPIYLFMGY